MGRDIVATCDDGSWVNYQCKHYDHPLWPSDVWTELGKLMFYTLRGDYPAPREYWFVAPQGAGTSLARLLNNPDRLRSELIANWDGYCRAAITATQAVELDTAMNAHISGFDFTIFSYVPPLVIIDGHRETPYYAARFGGGLPPRPAPDEPPSQLADKEAVYARALLDAYADHAGQQLSDVEALGLAPDLTALLEHFRDARREFYSAEALRSFSRDQLPPGEYERLQDFVCAGVIDVVRDSYDDAYRRVLAVVRAAKLLPLDSHALNTSMTPSDRGGICHQLVNSGSFRWTS